ncbi:MAG: hypothetical protein SPJ52_04905 [Candidatus Enterosoma sp.]|nr:hypothetical protein [bacterium]MDY5866458.1 hypothetical protein [Candidatus Enterosoma sp.]
MKKQEIQINRKNIVLRVILFLFFLTVGVTFIALYFTGVLQFQKGYSKIEIIPENQNIKADKIVYYAYFDGNSLSVRQNVKNLQGFYSPKANYVLMLTDEYANYESRNNLKTIADNEGKEVEVDEVLYKILQDAYTKSKEEKNYSLLGYKLFLQWDVIIGLDGLSLINSDPSVNSETKALLENQVQVIKEESKREFLSFKNKDEKFFVKASFTSEYKNILDDNDPLLSLGILKDAYIIDYLASQLEREGNKDGFLISSDGYIKALSEYQGGSYNLYDIYDDKISQVGSIVINKNESHCRYAFFDYYKSMYYSINGQIRYPLVNMKDGMASSFGKAFSMKGTDLLETSYNLLNFISLPRDEAISLAIKKEYNNLIFFEGEKKVTTINADEKNYEIISSYQIEKH